MFTLVHIPPSRRASADAATLVADYLAFDRARTASRPFIRLFAGLTLIVAIAAVFGRVPENEGAIGAGAFAAPAVALAILEGVRWHRLATRLDCLRAEAKSA